MFSKKKKILSTLTILAVAATATLGGLSFVGGSPAPFDIANADTTVVNKTSEADATKYYVGGTNDNGSGTSAEDPISPNAFAGKLIDLKPGNIVYIMPGTHAVTNTWALGRMGNSEVTGKYVNGTYDDYIVFKPYDENQDTALSFYGQSFLSTNRGVHIYGNYYYWYGIDVCGAGDNGLYIGGSYNVVENCEFYDNRDTGLQLGRNYSSNGNINTWPNYNLVKNCTSHNNYDNETYGENADGFAAKLTVGYGNVFDGCIAYRNSDDGWDLYGKDDTGIIGTVYMYNCIAFENGFLEDTQAENNARFPKFNEEYAEANANSYLTRDGDGNGFKLGGSTLEGDVFMNNCIAFNNRMHGVTDNSNPGVISLTNVTAYNNSAVLDNNPYSVIYDQNNNTAANNSDGKVEVAYRDFDEEGYILNEKGNRIILNTSGLSEENYKSIDDEGYILDSSGNRLNAKGEIVEVDDTVNAIKGVYAKGDKIKATVNTLYGQISGCDTGHNNIDLARSASSYNNLTGVLSVFNGRTGSGNDAYIGSTENSLLAAGSKWNKIVGALDANTITGKTGESVNAAAATDIFAALPANDIGIGDTHIHTAWRNADGSVKLGDLLKIKNYSLLLGDDNKIGANLVGDATTVYAEVPFTYLTDDSFTSEAQAKAQAIKDLIYLPVNQDAVYQDFDLASAYYGGVNVTWTSSDPAVISIAESGDANISGVTHVRATVYRDGAADKNVTLTATATVSGEEVVKQFEVVVKQNEYIVGDIVAENVVNDTYIVDLYSFSEEPEIEVLNAADYNGKLLPADVYEVDTTYMYAPVKGGHMVQVADFTPSNSGVYEITKTVSIGADSNSYTYTLYVVDANADVDFVAAPQVGVTYSGFSIKGTLNNVSGTLYAIVGEEGDQPAINDFRLYGQSYAITSDSVDAQFTADNDGEYYIYYAVANPNGSLTSEVYSTKISVVEISTKEQFVELASTGGNSANIYKLTADLDFSGTAWTAGNEFKALLDGQGHTVSNITVDKTGTSAGSIFRGIDGGSLMNIKFKNVSLKGDKENGLFGTATGGYIGNVKLENFAVEGIERIGGLIGRVKEQSGMDLIIERVSLVNDDNHVITAGESKYVGGLIGHMQVGSSVNSTYKVNVSISNCYVDSTVICGNSEAGGIVGKWDDGYNTAVSKSLTIDRCVFVGTVSCRSRAGGIIAYQTGSYPITITNCVSFGDIHHANSAEPIVVAEKNASGIFGGYNANAPTTVLGCYAKFAEHNQNYFVNIVTAADIATESFWSARVSLDLENIWQFVDGVLSLR